MSKLNQSVAWHISKRIDEVMTSVHQLTFDEVAKRTNTQRRKAFMSLTSFEETNMAFKKVSTNVVEDSDSSVEMD